MRSLAVTNWLLVATTLVHAAPSKFSHYDIWYTDGIITRPNLSEATFTHLINWCKRSLEHVFLLVSNRPPIAVPAPNSNDSGQWCGSGAHVRNTSSPDNRVANGCTDPSVRKEWRSMTVHQREAWVHAVQCLASLRGSGRLTPTVKPTDPINKNPPVNHSGSWYDDMSYVHMDLNTHIHQTGDLRAYYKVDESSLIPMAVGLFFPWHRYFLWSFEQTLKHHCGYPGPSPYWDWTQDAHDFKNSTIFHDSQSKIGLGGFGDPGHDNAVRDGPFAGLQLAYPSPHTLRREFTPYPFRNLTPPLFTNQNVSAASTFTDEKVKTIPSAFRGDFKAFQTYLEHMQGPHMSVHFIIGGDLGGSCPKNAPAECRHDAKWSPNEPIFWLHHAMLDKLWFDWQRAHPENFWAFEAGTIRDLNTWPKYPNGAPPAMTPDFPLPRNGILVGNYTVHDMFNTTSSAPLCYTYD